MTDQVPKLDNISQLFILSAKPETPTNSSWLTSSGDSYSDVGWRIDECPLPSKDKPMGIEHPAFHVQWCSRLMWQDNWVQHLSGDREAAGHDLRIYDFAVGGSEMEDVDEQSEELVELLEGGNVQLDPAHAVLAIWVGVNDVCALQSGELSSKMSRLRVILQSCYDVGFRHLVLFDVPPRPKAEPGNEDSAIYQFTMDHIAEWNAELGGVLQEWQDREGASGKMFGAHQVFANVLDRPEEHGFARRDPHTQGGGMWADHVHPTTAFHRVVFEAFKAEMS